MELSLNSFSSIQFNSLVDSMWLIVLSFLSRNFAGSINVSSYKEGGIFHNVTPLQYGDGGADWSE